MLISFLISLKHCLCLCMISYMTIVYFLLLHFVTSFLLGIYSISKVDVILLVCLWEGRFLKNFAYVYFQNVCLKLVFLVYITCYWSFSSSLCFIPGPPDSRKTCSLLEYTNILRNGTIIYRCDPETCAVQHSL